MTPMRSPARVAAGILLAGYCAAAASDPASDIEALRQAVEQMKAEYEKRIRSLEERLKAAEAAAQRAESAAKTVETVRKKSALDEAVAEVEAEEAEAVTAATAPSTALWSRRVGGADVRLMDISVNLMGTAGTSTESNREIKELQGGEHDPRRRGFTFQQAELAFKGAIDPYLTAETYIVASEEDVELEEAFFTTTSLPYDLQLRGGYFLTEFGIINPTHPHSWDWIDQPVINTRLFSGEGQRAAGFRLSKLLPTPWYSELMVGSQDPTNSTMVSFQGRGHSHGDEGEHEEEEHEEEEHEHEHISGDGVGGYVRVRTDDVDTFGDLTWFARWVNGWDFTEQTSGRLGFSFLSGSNTTGDDGDTYIFGSDLKVKWLPASNFRGYPYVKWDSEGMYRYYDVDRDNPSFQDPDQNLGNLKDWGVRTELGWGFMPRWEGGLRFEYANGNDKGPLRKEEDSLRGRRYRVSPILSWRPTEYSRFRLQYNWDDAQFLSDNAHSVWLGFDLSLGAHPAHKY